MRYHIYECFNLLSLKEKFHEILIFFFGWMQKWLMMFALNQLFGYLLIQHWWNKIFSSQHSVLAQCSITSHYTIYIHSILYIHFCKENRWVCSLDFFFFFFFLYPALCFVDFVFSLLTKVELVNIIHFQACLQVEYTTLMCNRFLSLRLSNQFHTHLW